MFDHFFQPSMDIAIKVENPDYPTRHFNRSTLSIKPNEYNTPTTIQTAT